MDDPWNWDVVRVVQELCSANRSWEPPSRPFKFPPPDQLENLLREHEVDGHTLITYDHAELCQELGFKTLKHKATLKHAVGIFRSRSQQYRLEQKRDFSAFEGGRDNPVPIESDSQEHSPISGGVSTKPLDIKSNDVSTGSKNPSEDAPDSKKRRVVPQIISPKADVTRNIIAEPAMVTREPALKASRRNNGVGVLVQPYLGDEAVSMIDLIGDGGYPENHDQLLETRFTFSQSISPYGRRLQVHRLLKRWFLQHRQSPDPFMRLDAVPRPGDPGHDEVLPLYGESDSEGYDSETWEEINEEPTEREEANRRSLTHEQILAVIDDAIKQFASGWKARKRGPPKVGNKANGIWVGARKTGLNASLNKHRRELARCQARITKLRDEISNQIWRDEAELKGVTPILEQTVQDRENSLWALDVIRAPSEPEKGPALPRRPGRKTRKTNRISASDEETLTSESEGELDGFIVYDEPSPSRMDVDDDGLMDIDQPLTIDLTKDDDDVTMASPKTPVKRQQVNNPVTPSGPAGGNGLGPIDQESPPRSLRRDIQDLDPKMQLVAKTLDKLETYAHSIITLTQFVSPLRIWENFLRPALKKKYPEYPYDTEEKRHVFVAYALLRLFDIYKDNRLYPPTRYITMSYDESSLNESQLVKFHEFINHIRYIALRFSWKVRPEILIGLDEPLLEQRVKGYLIIHGGRYDNETTIWTTPKGYRPNVTSNGNGVVDGSPSSKRKPKKKPVRNQEAQDLRDADQKRIALLDKRRLELRANFQRQEASGVRDVDSRKNMIINESKDDGQGFIYVHPEIAQRIKEHQVDGVRFMWDHICAKQGCLLAHTMGLGKTMQIITLLVAITQAAESEDLTISSQVPEDLRESRTLIICPATLVDNWMDELLCWAPDHTLGSIFVVNQATPLRTREANIVNWGQRGGVLVIGYNLFRDVVKEEELCRILQETPSLVVADEAHVFKNPNSDIYGATANFRTKIRIALTGTPLANRVEEYHSMINWVAPNYLSDIREFRREFVVPIREGLGADSDAIKRRKALMKLQVLKVHVGPKMQRKTIAVLKNDIPTKTEFVITVPLTDLQREAYETFVRYHHTQSKRTNSLACVAMLGLICAHPSIFMERLEAFEANEVKKVVLTEELVSSEKALLRKAKDLNEASLSWKIPMVTMILEESKRRGDSVLLFSQSIGTLDYLESIFRKKKISLERLDGSTGVDKRQTMVKEFNSSQVDLFLISTKAGGQGFNIVGANRVIIFDSRFNPMDEQQAVGRAYRIGQKKSVFVYRFVSEGTIEKQMLNLQIWKMQLASRVVDKKNPVPKANAFAQSLQLPTVSEPEDFSEHIGKDDVLDKVIEKYKSAIKAITITDTFEEEELENAGLSPEDQAEADYLIAQNKERRQRRYSMLLTPQPTKSSSTMSAPPPPLSAPQPIRPFGPLLPNGTRQIAPYAPMDVGEGSNPLIQHDTEDEQHDAEDEQHDTEDEQHDTEDEIEMELAGILDRPRRPSTPPPRPSTSSSIPNGSTNARVARVRETPQPMPQMPMAAFQSSNPHQPETGPKADPHVGTPN
ncbi:hypothetical protein F4819DRAFT_3984 [Hypoxylon fuscum]|nr:hypothetical protein F4819DRAFT_3984 [Hypoxylon fuscum]